MSELVPTTREVEQLACEDCCSAEETAADILLRDQAMKQIYSMSPREFQSRILDGTLPDFPRGPIIGIIRDTCHKMRLLKEEEFDLPDRPCNYAEAHKEKLRYISTEAFKQTCYMEFYQFVDASF